MPRNIPQNFVRPESLEEVERLLAATDGQNLIYLAGGTDLVVDITARRLPPCDILVYLDRIPELKGLSLEGDRLIVGSGVSHARLAASPEVRAVFPVLAQAAEGVGSPPIRVMGTVGGNLARASAAGDVATAVLSLNAEIHTLGPNGRRVINGLEFHVASRKTMLEPGELITHLSIPVPPGPCGSAFEKLGSRKTMFIASVSCAALLRLDAATGAIAEARLTLGSIAPTPVRAPAAEALLAGRQPEEAAFREAAEAVQAQVRPRTSHRGTSQYRNAMAGALTVRCLRRALENARDKEVEA